MSGAALGWAKVQSAPGVIAKAVLVCLADYADHEGVAWPSVPVLAKEVQVSQRTIQRTLRALEAEGLIETDVGTRQDGGRTSNRYRLAMTPVTVCHPPVTESHRPPVTGVTPPVTLLSPANDPPLEPTPSDEGVRALAKVSFEDWWSAYPAKIGKRTAAAAFEKAVRRIRQTGERDAQAVLTAGLHRSRASAQWNDPTYRPPNPATWLDQDRWLDEYAPAAGQRFSTDPPVITDPALRARHEALLRRTA